MKLNKPIDHSDEDCDCPACRNLTPLQRTYKDELKKECRAAYKRMTEALACKPIGHTLPFFMTFLCDVKEAISNYGEKCGRHEWDSTDTSYFLQSVECACRLLLKAMHEPDEDEGDTSTSLPPTVQALLNLLKESGVDVQVKKL